VAKKKKNNEPESTSVQVVRVIPGFTTQFKEDPDWWFKTDAKKASKILDLVSAVMIDPFQGIGKPEPLKYIESDL
jgi:toxin YoeB